MQWRRTALILVLIVLPLVTFGRVLGHGFVNWDDQNQLYENPDFNPPTLEKIARYWRGPHMNLYLPVTYTLWGGLSSFARLDEPDASGATLDARYFHAANLLIHLASILLVFAILRTLRVDDVPAAIGAAVFGVHPVMVEPVAWASATYTVLSGMFSLLAVWQYLRFARADSEGRRNRTAFAIGTAALVLAMLSKPSAVVVPVIVLGLDSLLVRRSIRRALPSATVWLLVALPIMIIAKVAQPAAWVEEVPLWQRPFVAADAVAFYLRKILVPLELAADYGRSPRRVLTAEPWFVTWIAPVALAALAWWLRRRAPWVAAALVVFIAGMGTYLGLVTFDFQYWSTVADRYLYVSMLAVAMTVAFALSSVRPTAGRPAAYLIAGLVVSLLAVQSWRQTAVWRDTQSLFAHTLRVNPDSVIAHNILAYRATRTGDVERAMAHYRATLTVRPRDAAANFNLANALLARGKTEQAVAHYRVAAEATPPNPLVLNNLGVALARSQQFDAAEQAFMAALEIDPRLNMAQQGLQRVRLSRAAAATQPATQPPAATQP